MRILATVTRPTRGKVTWDGTDIAARPDRLRRALGYLPQDFGVYPHLSAREFLSYLAALKGLPSGLARQRIGELLELFNLTGAGRRPLGKYPGGMLRRVGIAQALLADPRLLIVDEPTAGLDPEERVVFRGLISDLAADSGRGSGRPGPGGRLPHRRGRSPVMSARALTALAVADFRERTRRPAYLVTLAATVALAYLALPPADSLLVIVDAGGHRGVYNSAYSGTAAALAGGALFIPSLALALDTVTRSHRMVQAVYVIIWYAAVNQVAAADYMGIVRHGGEPAGASPVLVAGAAFALAAFAFAVRLARHAAP